MPNNEYDYDNLSLDIFKGKYTLVIGDDVILRKEQEYCSGNVRDYMRKRYGQQLREYDVGDTEKSEFSNFVATRDYSNYKEVMNPNVVKLLRTRCFRIVIVTNFDLYVETVLREVWGNKLKVFNIYDTDDMGALDRLFREPQMPPMLIYAFGRPDKRGESEYVCDENDKMNLLAQWFGDQRPKELINYLADSKTREKRERKRLLAVGCKFDDWFFRLFWYCLRQDTRCLRGDVAISLDSDDRGDQQLQKFMQKNWIGNDPSSDAFAFLAELCSRLDDYEGIYRQMGLGVYDSPQVFISYAHEDFHIVCQIYEEAKRNGYGVWFDDAELKPGDNVGLKAHEGIDKCEIFMPILSSQTRSDLEAGNFERYYFKEWNRSRNNKGCFVLPVLLSGFDANSDVHLLERLPEGSVKHWIKPDSADGMDATITVDWGSNKGRKKLIEGLQNAFNQLRNKNDNQ